MKYLLLFLIVIFSFAYETWSLEPSIQCTIKKVHSSVEILGFKSFPVLYQSINNDPINSKLKIANNEFKDLSPKTILKNGNTEKIEIKHKNGKLEIEVSGPPMSRNGTLKESGRLLADITCH